jgi:hypothetical protein
MADEGDKALPILHNFRTNKNKMRNCKSKTRVDVLDEGEEESKSFPKKKCSKKMSMVNLDDDDLLSSEDGRGQSSDSIDSLDSDNPYVLNIKRKVAAAGPINDDLGYLDDLLDDDDLASNKEDDIDEDDEDANIVVFNKK